MLPGRSQLSAATTEHLVGLVLRLYNQLLDDVHQGNGIMPGADEIAACESFAAGYAAAAALDPLWVGNADRWTFASPVAYLGGRLDLVPDAMLAGLESTSDTKETVRRDLAGIVVAARDSFDSVRRGPQTDTRINAAPRPGRNDPCDCGRARNTSAAVWPMCRSPIVTAPRRNTRALLRPDCASQQPGVAGP